MTNTQLIALATLALIAGGAELICYMVRKETSSWWDQPVDPDIAEEHVRKIDEAARRFDHGAAHRATFSADESEVARIAAQLSPLDRQLLLGECKGWGSWMWDSGTHMASLGLATRRGGSIQFDTPLAQAVIAYLKAQA